MSLETAEELAGLPVRKLEAELTSNIYPADVIREALEIEEAGQKRKTAIEALEDALESEPVQEPEVKAELTSNIYPADVIREALEIEEAGQKRKTAIEALEDALASEPVQEPEVKAEGHFVAKGKSVTTKAGIRVAGEKITAKILNGGDATLKNLISKGYVT